MEVRFMTAVRLSEIVLCAYVCMYVCMCMYVHKHDYDCCKTLRDRTVCICMYVCMYVCVCMYRNMMHALTHMSLVIGMQHKQTVTLLDRSIAITDETHTHTPIHTHIHTYIFTLINTHTYAKVLTYMSFVIRMQHKQTVALLDRSIVITDNATTTEKVERKIGNPGHSHGDEDDLCVCVCV